MKDDIISPIDDNFLRGTKPKPTLLSTANDISAALPLSLALTNRNQAAVLRHPFNQQRVPGEATFGSLGRRVHLLVGSVQVY